MNIKINRKDKKKEVENILRELLVKFYNNTEDRINYVDKIDKIYTTDGEIESVEITWDFEGDKTLIEVDKNVVITHEEIGGNHSKMAIYSKELEQYINILSEIKEQIRR